VSKDKMPISEQKGQFYLGRRVHLDRHKVENAPFLYDANDLTTHAVCVGMTGSGKTGLGTVLLEEAALNGLPALIVDPKGDMTNLLLLFPDLLPADFRPWVNAEEARRQDLSLDQYAVRVAQDWQDSLARWDIAPSRMARLKQGVHFAIYTPGSDAGRPLNILRSLQAPVVDWEENAELLREAIASTVSAILALIGTESAPVTGREHSLLATIIERAWQSGQDVDLASLISQVQNPPFDHMGVLPIEVFYPEKERMALVLALNGILASPRFANWLKGESLDLPSLLHAPDGRPQQSIFYLAHLSDSEKLFFITLLLEQVRGWLRTLEGSPDLRAILYIDELYGVMPPHPANPPTKVPLLALLKQARSQGLGLVLCSQNPVDLDYKGLANAGSWFIGKLQTANDRRRILEGLDSASAEIGLSLNSESLGETIAQLNKRNFLLNNIHAPGPVLFETRQTMCYLRGPLTRSQIRQELEAAATPQPARSPVPPSKVVDGSSREIGADKPRAEYLWCGYSPVPPVLPTGVEQFFVPVHVALEWAIHNAEQEGQEIIYEDKCLVYRPALMAQGVVHLDNAALDMHEQIDVSRAISVPQNDLSAAWDGRALDVRLDVLDERPAQQARFAPLPGIVGDTRKIERMVHDFADQVYQETSISLLRHRALNLTARPGESRSQFKRRCYQDIQERRDADIQKLEKSYQAKVERLEASIRREERELEQDKIEYDARKREEMISAGESVLNMLTRRRSSRMLSTASRKRRLTQQSKADLEESVQSIQDFQDQLDALLDELESEKRQINTRWSDAADDLDEIQVRPKRGDVSVKTWGVIWIPYWEVAFQDRGAAQTLSLPAFDANTD
jgi:hypothetical protein